MKIVVTAKSDGAETALDPRFGRARSFLLHDTETGTWSAHDNAQNLQAAQGAGIQAAAAVARLGAEVVVTGNVGPKAFRALQAAGIRVFLASEGSAADVVARFRQGALAEATAANVDGHWV
jgi:predicted Fe-Mo cluster-binding NifX family protein